MADDLGRDRVARFQHNEINMRPHYDLLIIIGDPCSLPEEYRDVNGTPIPYMANSSAGAARRFGCKRRCHCKYIEHVDVAGVKLGVFHFITLEANDISLSDAFAAHDAHVCSGARSSKVMRAIAC